MYSHGECTVVRDYGSFCDSSNFTGPQKAFEMVNVGGRNKSMIAPDSPQFDNDDTKQFWLRYGSVSLVISKFQNLTVDPTKNVQPPADRRRPSGRTHQELTELTTVRKRGRTFVNHAMHSSVWRATLCDPRHQG